MRTPDRCLTQGRIVISGRLAFGLENLASRILRRHPSQRAPRVPLHCLRRVTGLGNTMRAGWQAVPAPSDRHDDEARLIKVALARAPNTDSGTEAELRRLGFSYALSCDPRGWGMGQAGGGVVDGRFADVPLAPPCHRRSGETWCGRDGALPEPTAGRGDQRCGALAELAHGVRASGGASPPQGEPRQRLRPRQARCACRPTRPPAPPSMSRPTSS